MHIHIVLCRLVLQQMANKAHQKIQRKLDKRNIFRDVIRSTSIHEIHKSVKERGGEEDKKHGQRKHLNKTFGIYKHKQVNGGSTLVLYILVLFTSLEF